MREKHLVFRLFCHRRVQYRQVQRKKYFYNATTHHALPPEQPNGSAQLIKPWATQASPLQPLTPYGAFGAAALTASSM